jgi:hypothetical protein
VSLDNFSLPSTAHSRASTHDPISPEESTIELTLAIQKDISPSAQRRFLGPEEYSSNASSCMPDLKQPPRREATASQLLNTPIFNTRFEVIFDVLTRVLAASCSFFALASISPRRSRARFHNAQTQTRQGQYGLGLLGRYDTYQRV